MWPSKPSAGAAMAARPGSDRRQPTAGARGGTAAPAASPRLVQRAGRGRVRQREGVPRDQQARKARGAARARVQQQAGHVLRHAGILREEAAWRRRASVSRRVASRAGIPALPNVRPRAGRHPHGTQHLCCRLARGKAAYRPVSMGARRVAGRAQELCCTPHRSRSHAAEGCCGQHLCRTTARAGPRPPATPARASAAGPGCRSSWPARAPSLRLQPDTVNAPGAHAFGGRRAQVLTCMP